LGIIPKFIQEAADTVALPVNRFLSVKCKFLICKCLEAGGPEEVDFVGLEISGAVNINKIVPIVCVSVIYIGRWVPVFERHLQGRCLFCQIPVKHQYVSPRPHGVTPQKTMVLISGQSR
jgi:hypothetical protein